MLRHVSIHDFHPTLIASLYAVRANFYMFIKFFLSIQSIAITYIRTFQAARARRWNMLTIFFIRHNLRARWVFYRQAANTLKLVVTQHIFQENMHFIGSFKYLSAIGASRCSLFVPFLNALITKPFLASIALNRLIDYIGAHQTNKLGIYRIRLILWTKVRYFNLNHCWLFGGLHFDISNYY